MKPSIALPIAKNLAWNPVASPIDRRNFLRVSAAGLALAGVGCSHLPRISNTATDEKSLVLLALDEADRAGADYADVRISEHWFESVSAREQRITGVASTNSYGIGIRALSGGSWGFAATRDLSPESVSKTAREAAAIAKANDRVARSRITLAPVETFRDVSWVTPHTIDPFDVPIEQKAALLFATNTAALQAKGARFCSSSILSVKERRLIGTSEGSFIDQTFIRISPSATVFAVSSDGRDFQSREADVEPAGRGWEYVESLDLPARAPMWAEQAVMKLSAPGVEPGTWDLVLHPSNLWLTIHESIGHPTELDRALGYEANYAGTSFLAPPEAVLNKTRLGPEFMQFVGNRTEVGGCATVGWDDEGVPAEQWHIIRDGMFVDYQTTREQAAWIAPQTGITRSHGCAYGEDWSSMPFQRMPNVSLMPGDKDLSEDDVIGAVDRGVMVEGRGSYSIDQQRYNAQFAGQVFWEIKNGKKHRMLRDVAYVMRTPEFWNSLSLLGGAQTYYMGASFGDAKGQPGQANAVSHGCPIAVFRNANIINTA